METLEHADPNYTKFPARRRARRPDFAIMCGMEKTKQTLGGAPHAAPNVIELTDVRKTFRDFWLRPTVKAVDGLSLSVRKGEVFGLLSPSGGKISLFGRPPRAAEARRRLGYLPELSYLHPFLTAQETLGYYAGLSDLPRAEAKARTRELLAMVGLSDVAKRPVGGFSKGMARRVALAAALIGKPDLLVLDEPTSGLDPISTKEVKLLVKALRAGGMTILTTSHLLADAQEICDRVMILNHGACVAEGKVSELGTSLEDFFLAKVDDAKDFTLAPFLAG